MVVTSKLPVAAWLAAALSLGITGIAGAAANYVPGVYTGTGAYRRVFSDTGYSYMTAEVYLPGTPSIHMVGSDTPYVYTGGWGGGTNGLNATDAGFQYSPTFNDWSLFLSVSGVSGGSVSNDSVPRFEAGQALALQFDAVPTSVGSSTSTLQISATGVEINGVTATQTLSVPNVPNWSNASDTLKRMTSIAEANGDNFTDGSFINGVHWYDTTIGTSASDATTTWTATQTGGYQSYTSSVVSVNYVSATEETDSINLAVPEPTMLPMVGLVLSGFTRARRRRA